MRLMSYNVHGCVGTDGALSLERIAQVIEEAGVDVVALQEVDVRRSRSGGVDQAGRLAELLAMHSHFHAAVRVAEEEYGDAILSRHPLRRVQAGMLPTVPRPVVNERRGALWVEVQADVGPRVQIINTHLGLGREERRRQAAALLDDEWLGAALRQGPTIVCGDLNSLPGRRVHSLFTAKMRDVQRVVRRRHLKTFPSRLPWICLDHLFVSEGWEVLSVEVPRTPLTRRASDHLPLVVELNPPCLP
jgi:endonuclease/exonuclease/phosphatase family metal-dependent hydrolase